MRELELSIKLRDYEIDRVVNKIMNWKPSCKREGLRGLLEYAYINIIATASSFDVSEATPLIKSQLSYCVSIMSASFDVVFTDKQSEWIQLQLLGFLEHTIKNT